MKITDKHIQEDQLNWLICSLEYLGVDRIDKMLLAALLELKQRRAEDRMVEGKE